MKMNLHVIFIELFNATWWVMTMSYERNCVAIYHPRRHRLPNLMFSRVDMHFYGLVDLIGYIYNICWTIAPLKAARKFDVTILILKWQRAEMTNVTLLRIMVSLAIPTQ